MSRFCNKVSTSEKLTASPELNSSNSSNGLSVVPPKSGIDFADSSGAFPFIQPKLAFSQAGDKHEQEADAVANSVIGKTRVPAIDPVLATDIHSKIDYGLKQNSFEHALFTSANKGTTMDKPVKGEMENAFSQNFQDVRIHTGNSAVQMNRMIGANAFTHGNDIYFNEGQYQPESVQGKQLLAHELTHTIQQKGFLGGTVQMQAGGTATGPEQEPEWSRHLSEMLGCKRWRERHNSDSYAHCTGLMASISQTQDLYNALTSAQLQQISDRAYGNDDYEDFITVNKVMGVLALHYAGGDLAVARTLMRSGQNNADDLTPLTNRRNPDVDSADWSRNVGFVYAVRALREYANTFRSDATANTIGSRPFDRAAGQESAAVNYEVALNNLITELIRLLPQMSLTEDQKNTIYGDLLIVMRRAMVTGTWAAGGGMQDVTRVTDTGLLGNYRRLAGMLTGNMTNRHDMSIITDGMPSYNLPNPIPAVANNDFTVNGSVVTVDFSQVPANESDSVRYGVRQALRTNFTHPGNTIQFRNAYWPLVFPVRVAGNVQRIRYELVFDNSSNVRLERLGEASARQVDPAFVALSLADKKQSLINVFHLGGIDDRAALPAAGGQAAQAAAIWADDELVQIKAAYEMLPARDREALRGVTLVRGHIGPSGPNLQGVAHTQNSPTYDNPNPPAHDAPHIHYYDSAFTSNNVSFVGPPGSTGPRSEWTIIHEVGHMVMNLDQRRANAAIAACGNIPGFAGFASANQAQVNAFGAWRALTIQLANDVVSYNAGVIASPQMAGPQLDALELSVTNGQGPRDLARNHADFPGTRLAAATARDQTADCTFTASRQLRQAMEHNQIFIDIANRLGFHQFTDYARTGDPGEWFAETYALYVSDPDRLNEMHRGIFQWFEAGMPFDRTWTPPNP